MGYVYEADSQTNFRPSRRLRLFFDFLHRQAFHAYGYVHPVVPTSAEVRFVAPVAKERDLEVHAFTTFSHPLHMVTFQNPPKRAAAAAVIARRAANAHKFGATSFTFAPPRRDVSTLDEFADEVESVLDEALPTADETRIHVVNPPEPDRHLHRLEDLIDFQRQHRRVHLTVHAGHAWVATREILSVDAWKELLSRLPPSTLFAYANMSLEGDRFGPARYVTGESNSPPLRSLLQALAETKRRATLLVDGARVEEDTAEVFAEAAKLYGVNPVPILESRYKPPRRSNLGRPMLDSWVRDAGGRTRFDGAPAGPPIPS